MRILTRSGGRMKERETESFLINNQQLTIDANQLSCKLLKLFSISKNHLNEIDKFLPNPCATLLRNCSEGLLAPLSSRAILLCLVPIR